MIKSYFVDGDKGGVGKSFASRCLVDSFINHEVSGMPKIDKLIVIDADPMNPDVVCDNGYKNEAVNNIHVIGLQRPIKSEDDWLNLINELAETQINETDEIRLVFSLPSAAGLYITAAGSNRTAREGVKEAGLEFTPVETVAQAVWDAAHGSKVHIVVGKTAKNIAFAARWAPWLIIRRSLRLKNSV